MKRWLVLFVVGIALASVSCGRNNGSADDEGGEGGGSGSTRTGDEASVVIAAGLSGALSSTDGILGEGPATSDFSIQGTCPEYLSSTAGCADAGNGTKNYGIQFSACTRGATKGLWNGGMILSFSNGAVCGESLPSKTIGATVNRNFVSGTTVTYDNGFSIVVDTLTKKGYANPVSGGSTVKVTAATGDLNVRSLKIDGFHVAALLGGNPVWDHTFSTDEAGLTVVGVGNDRQVTTGAITVQHNLAKVVSTSRIIEPLTYKKSNATETVCCFPTAGTIYSTFEGGKYMGKIEKIKFGPKCGQATISTVEGRDISLMLNHCL